VTDATRSLFSARRVVEHLDEIRATLSDLKLAANDESVRSIVQEAQDAVALAADQIEAMLARFASEAL